MKQLIFFTLVFFCTAFVECTDPQKKITVGNSSFVHLEQIDNVWWLVDGNGNKFISTGMNHMQANIRFAPYNENFWGEKFGEDIMVGGKFNPNALPEIKKWMAQAAKDHKEYGFNTIPFHRALNIPDEYFEDLEIFYLGKIKTGIIHAQRVKLYSPNGKFPDVFSEGFKKNADKIASAYCAKHKNNKFMIGYTYEDLPSYEYSIYKMRYLKDTAFAYHPWVADIINKEGLTEGKKMWMEILKKHYNSPIEAGKNYHIELKNWKDLGKINNWSEPNNKEKWLADQEEMNKLILEMWHKINREAIHKYDSNHLILGDKIFCHGPGHPAWVYEIVGKYVDVLLIQDFEMFTASHVEELTMYHQLSGKPILNGDHAYSYTVEEMRLSKGLQVESQMAVGEEYTTYMKGIMNLPFMLGWHNCGYLEQWKGGRLDDTGKQQGGFFDPYGKPRIDALDQIKKANTEALLWHESAGNAEFAYSRRKQRWE
ncbi:MAG: hypothetical protein AAGA10_20120 [Bacteroidota bacterium]